ncbi:efflux RND transporter periplasmic adaptor subunit [Myroides injenensis]|uniref:efflux RND transporter periplasmic adaptor subunit n=1 Tax=Myroides injenensis TaxID=1183151 RepID=UPI000289DFC1|nr:efflux RND transporter periplasmic adaptor subunit [Myroides injenensis]
MKKNIIIFALLITALLFSCKGKEEDHSGHDHTNENNEKQIDENTNKEVELNAAQYKAANVELGGLSKKNLTDVIKVNGQTELPPQNQADVTSFVSGSITQIYVNVGDRVSKGQLLATAESPEFIKLQEEYLVSKSNLEYLELEYKRQQTLRAENVNSEKTYQKIKSDLTIEKSRFTSLSNQLNLLNVNPNVQSRTLRIIAPISGNISNIGVKIGSNMSSGQSLLSIVDNSKIHLDLMVYEKDLPNIAIGQKVSFTLTNINKTEVTATIFSIGKAFEPGTKTVVAHANIDKVPENLIPGLYVNALIHIGQHEVEALPNDAIIKADGREFIFVLEKDDNDNEVEEHYHFQRIEVKSGVKELGFTEVTLLQPIEIGDNIVLKGAYYLQSHLVKNEGGGGHSH